MDNTEKYDDFGNYIGDISEDEQEYEEDISHLDNDIDNNSSIVQYNNESIYGNDVEFIVSNEDIQSIKEPIIEPIKYKIFYDYKTDLDISGLRYNIDYFIDIMNNTNLIRNISIVGHLHSGKTSLIDMLVNSTIEAKDINSKIPSRFTDTIKEEQTKGISIKAKPISLLLSSLAYKSYFFNIFDTPGHSNFYDEVNVAYRASDGVVLVVDVAEGVLLGTETCLKLAIAERLGNNIVLILNKVDRLILEMRLPPRDCYLKILHTLAEINEIMSQNGSNITFSPRNNNVLFASTKYKWIFSIESFVKLIYTKKFPWLTKNKTLCDSFIKKLWGDYYFDRSKITFLKSHSFIDKDRSFVEFILSPLYKLHSAILSESVTEDNSNIHKLLSEMKISLPKTSLLQDSEPLLSTICSNLLGSVSCFVSSVVENIPNPKDNAPCKIPCIFSGNPNNYIGESLSCCNEGGPLLVNIVKLIPRSDTPTFDAFGRVYSGTIRSNSTVWILGENFSNEDKEDSILMTIHRLWVYVGRYRVEVQKAIAGNWILIEGVDSPIIKTATLFSNVNNDSLNDDISNIPKELCIFHPLHIPLIPVMKVAVEPRLPSNLPLMTESLRKINKTYNNCIIKVEESGEHSIIGTGEMQLDCILHDLRYIYSDIEINVSDPLSIFSETIVDASPSINRAYSTNQANLLEMIAEPLPIELANNIERHNILIDTAPSILPSKYNFDSLEAASVWAFGPSIDGPNIISDHTLPDKTDPEILDELKPSIIQGFRWGTRNGPLCDEPMRNLRFKIIHGSFASSPIQRSAGQIIPLTRNLCYSSFLSANPRLLEPYYFAEITTSNEVLSIVSTLLNRRRGYIKSEEPKPGTSFSIIKAELPVIDSFSFETDLRTHSKGKALVSLVFDRWDLVPGDPLDKSIEFKPLEPAPIPYLAREFMIKTRRRKGLSEDL